MPAPIITVENLSKRYFVGHRAKRESDPALRELLGRELKNAVRKTADLVRGRQIVQGDEIEEFWALRDVSFEVQEGEVLGIIGRNGAGKSTLLKILSRITRPTEGRVTIGGRVASLLEVGTGFHPELSGRENIYLNGAVLGMTRLEIRRKFDEIVAFAEVEKFLDTPVKRYSSGMYVRLAFAVAAHLEPEILIVDEVLAVGDAEFQKKCLGKMDEVSRREGRTVLFVSHNMAAMQSLSKTGLMLQAGIIRSQGAIGDVIANYQMGKSDAANRWIRPSGSKRADVVFDRLAVSFVEGPAPRLSCTMEITVRARRADSMVAIDVQDPLGASIMQALPSTSPFVPGEPGCYRVLAEILLPALTPGSYSLCFWIGPHYTETYDLVSNALRFDVIHSPTPGRTFPHSADHGHIVPQSSYKLLRLEGVDELQVAG